MNTETGEISTETGEISNDPEVIRQWRKAGVRVVEEREDES